MSYRTENYPEHYNLIMKFKTLCERFSEPVLSMYYIYIVVRNRQLANYIIFYLQDLEIIQINEYITDKIRQCMNEKKDDKRIKNVKKYCMRKYGNMKIDIKLNCNRLLGFWDRYITNKYYNKILFPEYIMTLNQ